MTTTFERLCDVLVKYHHLGRERLSPAAPLESLGIDSLGTVELLWNVEDAFDVKLPPEPVDLPTLADVVRYIDALVIAQATQPVVATATGPAAAAATAPTPPLLHRP